MKVSIIGSGPSGLVAAWAAAQYGAAVNIYTPGQRSDIWGAQYLHQPIPGINFFGECEVIRYQMVGRPEEYLEKVYGDLWDGHISDDLRDQAHMAWDLRAAYASLWTAYEPVMESFHLTDNMRSNYQKVQTLLAQSDIVVNTVPRNVFCMLRKAHEFRFTEIWAMGDSDAQRVPIPTKDGIITYNGDPEISWYRASRVYGYSTVEWPAQIPQPPLPGVARVRKPINHTCNCIPNVKHLGRMGRWDKNVLLHDVYAGMTELLMIHEEEK